MFVLFVMIRYRLNITIIFGKTEQHKYFYFDNKNGIHFVRHDFL